MNLNEAKILLQKNGYKIFKENSQDSISKFVDSLIIDAEQTKEQLQDNTSGMATYVIVSTRKPGLYLAALGDVLALNDDICDEFGISVAEIEDDYIEVSLNHVEYRDNAIDLVKEAITKIISSDPNIASCFV